MTTPAVREDQSPLEAALLGVHATLVELLVAADEQHAAVVARDRDRLEGVTRQQERLSTRLARAEAKRLEILSGVPLSEALSSLAPAQAARARALSDSIGRAVTELKLRHGRTASLLEQSISLMDQTVQFLQRLLGVQSPAYGARGLTTPTLTLRVDSRA
jgi:uncharacterized membrane protein YqiK